MFKKLSVISAMILMVALLVAGCGDSKSGKDFVDGAKSMIGGSAGYGDLYHDKEAIKKAVADIKSKGGSEELMIFQSMQIGPEFISFRRQDPKNLENVDSFDWGPDSGWSGPKIVKLRGDGELADNLFNINAVNWEAIPVFVAEVEELIKKEDLTKGKFGKSIFIDFSVRSQKLQFRATVKGERKDAAVTGDITTGKVTSFKVK